MCWLWTKTPRLYIIALTTLSHEHTRQRKSKRRTKRVRRNERNSVKKKEKSPVKRQSWSISIKCIHLWEQGINMLNFNKKENGSAVACPLFPGDSLTYIDGTASQDLLLAMRRRASSSRLHEVCGSWFLSTPVGDRQVRFAGGGCPLSKTSSIVILARNVNDSDPEPVRKGKNLFELEELQRASSSYWRCMHVLSECMDRYVDDWILKLSLPFTRHILEITDRPTHWPTEVCERNCPTL